MAEYILKALFANTCPRVHKVANELKSNHKVVYCKGQKVIFSFSSECSKDATEHSRDILNTAIEKGLFVAAACLLRHDTRSQPSTLRTGNSIGTKGTVVTV